jgi:hypothetical protein
MLTKSVTIKLDVDRPISFGFRAIYNIGELNLKNPPELQDLSNRNMAVSYPALVKWVWAMLEGRHPFKTPAELQPFITSENLAEIMQGVLSAVEAEMGIEGEKKTTGLTPGPLPESS